MNVTLRVDKREESWRVINDERQGDKVGQTGCRLLSSTLRSQSEHYLLPINAIITQEKPYTGHHAGLATNRFCERISKSLE